MTNPVKDKKILLLCTRFFNYDQLVANKLKELGATVDLYDARAELSTVEKAILKYSFFGALLLLLTVGIIFLAILAFKK